MSGLTLGPALSPAQAAELRPRLAFEHGKYDLQVGDHSSIATRPILLSASTWQTLAHDAEALWREAVLAERAALAEPTLLRRLGLPPALRREIERAPRAAAHIGARFVRFDFHPTAEGWRISEINADVPGGFLEAAALTALFLEIFPDAAGAGDPCAALASVLARDTASGDAVALIHATAYSDDRQSMTAIASRLASLGARAVLIAPDQLRTVGDTLVAVHHGGSTTRIGAAARFFPAEWLPNLASARSWRPLVSGEDRCILNPAIAVVTQTKRLPLIWDRLGCPMPTWRRLLPRTVDPRSCRSLRDWALKPALGRVGESIYLPGAQPLGERKAPRLARRHPGHWIAQERFLATPVTTDDGSPFYPCVGVFVLDGEAVGAYGRLAPRPLIDQHAQEAAVLILREPEAIAA